MKRIVICLISAALGGCCTPIPVVPQALTCVPTTDTLAPCGAAGDIKQGITFGELITVSGQDRDTLKNCAARQEDLVKAVATCNKMIEEHNAKVREINAIIGKK